jgi:hypothetical protein
MDLNDIRLSDHQWTLSLINLSIKSLPNCSSQELCSLPSHGCSKSIEDLCRIQVYLMFLESVEIVDGAVHPKQTPLNQSIPLQRFRDGIEIVRYDILGEPCRECAKDFNFGI